MLILGIDTATARGGVAIGGADGVRASFHLVHGRKHVETLAPAIQFVCREAGVELAALDAVAVDTGPGTFTGLRVGAAAARTIAHACSIPAIGVSSLEIVAYAARLTPRRIVAILDALRDEVFYASFAAAGGGVARLSPSAVAKPSDVARDLEALGEECLAVGDGARRYASTFAALPNVTVADVAFDYPSAAALIAIAAPRLAIGQPDPGSLDLHYLREPYIHPQRQG